MRSVAGVRAVRYLSPWMRMRLISYPNDDRRTMRMPVERRFTMTVERETYVNSNRPLYVDRRRHES